MTPVPEEADAVVVGSGPNGLVAGALLARAGWSVVILERDDRPGGAVRSDALTAPGFVHDTMSAFYGLLHASPVLRELELDRRVEWARFSAPVAAAVRPGVSGICHRDPEATAAALKEHDEADGQAWLDLVRWWRRVGRRFLAASLRPLPSAGPGLSLLAAAGPRGMLELARRLLTPVDALSRQLFASDAARALLCAGVTHTDLSVASAGSSPGALVLALVAQEHNMPVPVGGAGRLAEALTEAVTEAGGAVVTGAEVAHVVVEQRRAVGVETAAGERVAARRAVLADCDPGALFHRLVGTDHLPNSFLAGLRGFRHGSGIFKLDLALDGPAPWADPALAEVGVVHLTGDLPTMVRSAAAVHAGDLPDHPLLVVGQQSVADATRAPAGGHTLWVETHVPPATTGGPTGGWSPALRDDYVQRLLDRLEHLAPGLISRVVGVRAHTPADLEAADPNLVGGDLGGGSAALDQQVVFRPVPGWYRYRTPVRSLYLCSASAHPGGGVHGMVGRNCAGRVLRDHRKLFHHVRRTIGGEEPNAQ